MIKLIVIAIFLLPTYSFAQGKNYDVTSGEVFYSSFNIDGLGTLVYKNHSSEFDSNIERFGNITGVINGHAVSNNISAYQGATQKVIEICSVLKEEGLTSRLDKEKIKNKEAKKWALSEKQDYIFYPSCLSVFEGYDRAIAWLRTRCSSQKTNGQYNTQECLSKLKNYKAQENELSYIISILSSVYTKISDENKNENENENENKNNESNESNESICMQEHSKNAKNYIELRKNYESIVLSNTMKVTDKINKIKSIIDILHRKENFRSSCSETVSGRYSVNASNISKKYENLKKEMSDKIKELNNSLKLLEEDQQLKNCYLIYQQKIESDRKKIKELEVISKLISESDYSDHDRDTETRAELLKFEKKTLSMDIPFLSKNCDKNSVILENKRYIEDRVADARKLIQPAIESVKHYERIKAQKKPKLDSEDISNLISINEKITLCKYYIGHIFSKPLSSIMDYKTEGDIIYVKYLREHDQTTWRFACEIKNNYMVWAAFHENNNTWGRWRNEEGVVLIVDKNDKSISFTTKDTGEFYKITR